MTRSPAGVTALAVVVYVLCLPLGWTDRSPLSWDQAGHYLDALRFSHGLSWGDGPMVGTAILGADLYPPLHSVLLGLWMLLVGQGAMAWFTFGMVVHGATAYLLARIHPVAGIVFVASPLLGGLAPTLMVEPIACLLLLIALLAFPADTGGVGRMVGFALLTTLVLLTKYNVGLPLLPAAMLAAVIRPRRTLLIRASLAVLASLSLWALFLSFQHSGWSMFLDFAQNRSNSSGSGFFQRIAFYGRVLGGRMLPGSALAIAVSLVAVGGLYRGRPETEDSELSWRRATFALAYVVFSLVALGWHEYLLSRNMVGPTVGLLAAGGWGLRLLPHRRQALASAMVLILVVGSPLIFDGPSRREFVQDHFPSGAARLDALSLACEGQMQESGRTRIVGTFNEFSPGWVKILALRANPRNSLRVGVRCPLPRSRTGYPAQWLPEYGELVAGWGSDGTRRVLALRVEPDSPYHTRDYEQWNAWKLNLLRALEESPDFAVSARADLDCGVGYTLFTRRPPVAD